MHVCVAVEEPFTPLAPTTINSSPLETPRSCGQQEGQRKPAKANITTATSHLTGSMGHIVRLFFQLFGTVTTNYWLQQGLLTTPKADCWFYKGHQAKEPKLKGCF